MKLSEALSAHCSNMIDSGFEKEALLDVVTRLAAISDGLRNGNSSAEFEVCKIADDARAICDRINSRRSAKGNSNG